MVKVAVVVLEVVKVEWYSNDGIGGGSVGGGAVVLEVVKAVVM